MSWKETRYIKKKSSARNHFTRVLLLHLTPPRHLVSLHIDSYQNGNSRLMFHVVFLILFFSELLLKVSCFLQGLIILVT